MQNITNFHIKKLPKIFNYQKSHKNREILPKVIKITKSNHTGTRIGVTTAKQVLPCHHVVAKFRGYELHRTIIEFCKQLWNKWNMIKIITPKFDSVVLNGELQITEQKLVKPLLN